MSTFQRCTPDVELMAKSILEEFDSHAPLRESKATVDFVFAYAEIDEETGALKGDALKHQGVRALGICRKLSTKDRAMGRGDAEIALDGDWWRTATDAQRRALLDHELHHLEPKIDDRGYVTDDLQRPVLKLRKHDFQFGWFSIIAARHGQASCEVVQARQIMDEAGQFYWPELVGKVVQLPGKKRGAA